MGLWRTLKTLTSSNLCPACEGNGWTVKTREEKLVCPACEGSRDWRQTGGASGGGAGGGI